MEWWMVREGHWIFGEKVRGVIRWARAEVQRDITHALAWNWWVCDAKGIQTEPARSAANFGIAVEAAEKVLGIVEKGDK